MHVAPAPGGNKTKPKGMKGEPTLDVWESMGLDSRLS